MITFDFCWAYGTYDLWLKKKTILLSFPSWENTNKPNRWWKIWTFLAFTNIIPYTLCNFIVFKTMYFAVGGAFLIILFYLIAGTILYFIVKNILKNKENK